MTTPDGIRIARHSLSRLVSCGRQLLVAGCFLAAAAVPVEAQDDSGNFVIGNDEAETPAESYSSGARPPADGFDFQIRAGHIVGPTLGRDTSITPIEIFPYLLLDNNLFFSDLRMYLTNRGEFGGNAGTGVRHYHSDLDRVFGASLWYDGDDSTGAYFQQVGLSLETYGKYFDARTNFYLPVGDTQRQLAIGAVPGSTHFAGTSVIYDQARTLATGMKGLDMEIGAPVWGEFARDRDLRVYGGWYHFEGSGVEDIWGWKTRVQANVFAALDMQIQVTSDQVYDTNVILGATWTFGRLHRSRVSQATTMGRIGEAVQRNYNVISPKQTVYNRDLVAVDPATRNPYVVAHVSSSAAGTFAGTVNNPYQTLAQAQAANPDIIYVQAGSVFNGADSVIALNPNQRVLGEGTGLDHYIRVPNIGDLLLPRATAGTDRPIFQNATGDAITLASGSEFSGFSVLNASGRGIFGNGVNGATVSNVNVTTPGGDGIFLQNSAGTLNLTNVTVTDALGAGLHVDGGSSNINYTGTVTNHAGRALVVENTASGLVNLAGMTLTDDGGTGILLQNDTGNVTLGNLSLSNNTASAIDVLGGAGEFLFQGTTTIQNPTGTGINVQNLGAAGFAQFSNVAINGRQGVGIGVNNNSGELAFGTGAISNGNNSASSAFDVQNSSGSIGVNSLTITGATGGPAVNIVNNTGTTAFTTLNITSNGGTGLFTNNGGTVITTAGTISATNAAALDLHTTALGLTLTSVSSSNTAFGLQLDHTTGYLAVMGSNNTLGSGGTVQNTTTGAILNTAGQVGFANMDFTTNAVGISSANVSELDLVAVRITDSTSYAVDALNTHTMSISNSLFQDNGTANESIRTRADTTGAFAYTLTNTSIINSTGDGFTISSQTGSEGATLSLTVMNSDFENSKTGARGINVDWKGPLNGVLTGNSFLGAGGSYVGVNVNSQSTTGLADLLFKDNHLEATGGNDVGFRVAAAGASRVIADNNAIGFGASNSTALDLTLAPSADVQLLNNLIQSNGDGGTGFLFSSVDIPSSVTINNNTLNFANTGNLIDRGVFFSSVAAPSNGNFVRLQGNQNNVINGADQTFFAPLGTLTGTILINNVPAP